MEPFLREGYLGRLVPDMRQSLKEQLYNDCDGFTFTPVTRDPEVQWIAVTRGRLKVNVFVDPTVLTRGDVGRFSKDIWTKDYTDLYLTGDSRLEYIDEDPFIVGLEGPSSIADVPSLPLCKQLIDALLAVAS